MTSQSDFPYHYEETLVFSEGEKPFKATIDSTTPYPVLNTVAMRVHIDGIMHPLLEYENYIGPETTNPRLLEALGVIHECCNRVLSQEAEHNPIIMKALEEAQDFDKIGVDTDRIYLTFPEEHADISHRLAQTVCAALEAKKPEIEAAIERGKTLPLNDPNADVETAFKSAVQEIETFQKQASEVKRLHDVIFGDKSGSNLN